MKYNEEKKKAIVLYILEKISAGTSTLSRDVAEAFGISANTAHAYINELIDQGIIKKEKRGAYDLVTTRHEYVFSRSRGELDEDSYIYADTVREHVEHLSDNVKAIWSYAVSEMANNVIEHSSAETMRVVVYTNYFKTAVVIIDDGVGIFNKLKSHFSLSRIDDVICELMKGKLTTDAEHHSGEGIFFSSKLMDRFLIYSGGKIFCTTKYNDEDLFDVDIDAPGTRVMMVLSNFTKRKSAEVFDLYSDVDGGLISTRISLGSLFDAYPVSRSQAKRLYHRLEKFQEVILDFDGVSWMGQGFAHELFVVFHKTHDVSHVRLVPINMCPDVIKMLKHVLP